MPRRQWPDADRAPAAAAELPPQSNKGLILAGAAATLVAFGAAFGPFLAPAIRKHCLPYIPATTTQVNNVRAALARRGAGAAGTAPPRCVDLGSGDGRLVIEAAKQGYRADGVELNPWLNLYAAGSSLAQGTFGRTSFRTQDLWKVPYEQYDDIIVFGVSGMMGELHATMASRMRADARLVVCRFAIPGVVPTETIGEGIDSVWIYASDAELREGHLPKGAPRPIG